MSSSFDLSDALKQAPSSLGGPGGPGGGQGGGRGTGTRLDEYARPVLWGALAVAGLLLTYLFYCLYGGPWSHEVLAKDDAAFVAHQHTNMDAIFGWVQKSLFVALVALVICCLRDEGVGYVLLGFAAVFYFGVPWITDTVYSWQKMTMSSLGMDLNVRLQSLAWLFGFPGLAWTVADFIRRFKAMSEAVAIQRVNVKFGAAVAKQNDKKRNVFLGRCFELPYCRAQVREKCPIYLKRVGPCWWYKEGCMCEERIVLQAVISSDWKQQTASLSGGTGGQLGLGAGMPQKRQLSPAAKRERCRSCIIYNEHQQQKYKALTGLAIVLIPLVTFFNLNTFRRLVSNTVHIVEGGIKTLTPVSGATDLPGAHTDAVQWILIVTLALVLLTLTLRLIEFCCFKLKV